MRAINVRWATDMIEMAPEDEIDSADDSPPVT